MRNKLIRVGAVCLAALFLCAGFLPGVAADAVDAQSIIDGIVAYKLKESGASSVQQWINGALVQNAGSTSEWYAIGLSQHASYDLSAYQAALVRYLDENEVYSASSRQKYALALVASGSTDTYISTTLNDSIGQQGVMSWVYGLHLLNNGYQSQSHTLSAVRKKLLSLQLADGGWAVMGVTGDVDVTAMTVQALAPHYHSDTSTKQAVDKALILLSDRQLDSGEYVSNGVPNPESAAQVLVALSSLGIDGKTDSRFIKNGNTLLDGIWRYRLVDGSFCHQPNSGYSETATAQVFYAMVAYRRMANGQTPLYLLDAADPVGLTMPASTTAQSTVGRPVTARRQTRSTTMPSGDRTQATTVTSDESVHFTQTTAALADNGISSVPTEVTTSTHTNNAVSVSPQPNSPYKWWVSFGIGVSAVGVCAVLYLLRKRNKRNFLFVLVVAALLVGLVWLSDFQTTDAYYGNAGADRETAVGTVTLTIRCDTVAGKEGSQFIPANGIILDTTELAIQEGDTVYDALVKATAQNRLHLETTGGAGAAYVEGIHHLYEFDFGDLSGWVYHVNGKPSSTGCGEHILSDGDRIEWLYTCNLGEDVK